MSLLNIERVLVPIDFSEASFNVLEQALEFVKDPARLHVLHVLPHLNPGDPGIMWNQVNDQTRKQHVEEAFRQRYPDSQYPGIHFSSAIGSPSSEIIDYAKAHNITLIAISSHGYTGLSRFLLGSVTEKVIRYAHCPVLVLRQA
ncbi:universal stress protein [Desertifilum sp. FACHB-1129]|uniref:Universal stress protein UspA n=2 Tax=Desertifilum tharense IPPAS B-1220 TaxID=1781255 RepID=A0A1E5QJK6_9CYAN|nr:MULTISPECIES: universal stress protein [Desertifilum]MCD8486992.1 universal stress protein [Desertifilum sp.]MDA0211509.1 universal stress protein [Cyanobacteria bacterium FC1]MDL5051661.1 universal stress protein [Oscillatoria amoena NRMC-F 0135]MBD2314247.1 universal stress protein [Desertifilum sp. FACHB-1129]MBD2324695.1 universal stress protein [Desertifilum sp. FACHB-866]